MDVESCQMLEVAILFWNVQSDYLFPDYFSFRKPILEVNICGGRFSYSSMGVPHWFDLPWQIS
jgi:hypothetical protein